MNAKIPKTKYTIIGREKMREDWLNLNLDCVHVEWTRTDGGHFEDFHSVPVSHPPNIRYERQSCGKRLVVHDQVNVPEGCPDSIIMQILEEKRLRLEAAFGL